MSRVVKRTHTGPMPVMIDGEEKWLCRCGLSKDQPYCDGSHKRTKGEDPGKVYWYDDDGQRHEATETFPGIRTF